MVLATYSHCNLSFEDVETQDWMLSISNYRCHLASILTFSVYIYLLVNALNVEICDVNFVYSRLYESLKKFIS